MRVLLLSLCLLLGGCAAGIEDYQGTKPALELDKFFNGKVLAHGMFQDYSGKVIKRFTVEVEGKWQGNTGTLDEHFTYSDGSTQRRVWTLEKLPGGQYQGQASDVIGTAKGKAVGMAFQWGYTLRLTMDNGDTLDVTMDDWMYQLDARHLMNRTTMKKFGLAVGEVTLFFEKQ